METTQAETSRVEFTSTQKQTLGRLYGFLIELGRKRLQRLEQESCNTDAKPTNYSALEMEKVNEGNVTG